GTRAGTAGLSVGEPRRAGALPAPAGARAGMHQGPRTDGMVSLRHRDVSHRSSRPGAVRRRDRPTTAPGRVRSTMADQDLRSTALEAVHESLGATFTDFAGWRMPVRYDSDLAEHRAVRESAGIFDLSHMGRSTCAARRPVTPSTTPWPGSSRRCPWG